MFTVDIDDGVDWKLRNLFEKLLKIFTRSSEVFISCHL